ncbi:surfeit locus protein 6 homolog [Epargyreus clarus]|uniref:surfeit locus protein 6 homolog n=1 Tax=Epargyreus clarus TaxID=520877 RepID=UPI003C2D9E0D
MPSKMAPNKKPLKNKHIKNGLLKEINFLKNIFSVMSLPVRKGDENQDFEMTSSSKQNEEKELPQRARSIAELEEKLEKIKSQNKFNLKNKLVKKSLSSKLNKKLKKRDRLNAYKTRVKGPIDEVDGVEDIKEKVKEKANVTLAKPIFNTEGKLVFSKFDFAKVGKDKKPKEHKDPKKILENIKQQEQKFQELAESGDTDKVKEMKQKILWKNTLQKAEGQKVKDDPTLLKKSIKRQEQKKKVSKKQWDNRIQSVEQKKDDRQKKRKENIMKKKKEKKAKVVKAATKRGRVVI